MSDLLERLEARAPGSVGPVSHHNTNYNFPLAWYRRPDGDIVQLQSDPNNRAMYEDLGFVILRPLEAREWETEVRPEVIAGQKKKAALISAIRRMESQHPQIILDPEENEGFSSKDATVDYLEQFYRELCEQVGIKPRPLRIPPEKPTVADGNLAGVETSASHSREELEGKLQRGQGYDPMKEARRR